MASNSTATVTDDAAVAIATNPAGAAGTSDLTRQVILRNVTATATIYLGDSDVTDSDGFPWDAADGPFSCPLEPGEVLYARLASGGGDQSIRALRMGR